MRADSSSKPPAFTPERIRELATAEQYAALSSGDAAKIREANDRALAQAMLLSLADLPDSPAPAAKPATPPQVTTALPAQPGTQAPGNMRSGTTGSTGTTGTSATTSTSGTTPTTYSPTEAHYAAARQQTREARTWLDRHGFDVIPNGGGGASNCLLISLMQHAKGDYSCEHTAEVNSLRQALILHTGGRETGALFGDTSKDGALAWLVDTINKNYALPERTLSALMMHGFAGGQPAILKVGNGKIPAMIFESNAHFEAVVPRGTVARASGSPQPPR